MVSPTTEKMITTHTPKRVGYQQGEPDIRNQKLQCEPDCLVDTVLCVREREREKEREPRNCKMGQTEGGQMKLREREGWWSSKRTDLPDACIHLQLGELGKERLERESWRDLLPASSECLLTYFVFQYHCNIQRYFGYWAIYLSRRVWESGGGLCFCYSLTTPDCRTSLLSHSEESFQTLGEQHQRGCYSVWYLQ